MEWREFLRPNGRKLLITFALTLLASLALFLIKLPLYRLFYDISILPFLFYFIFLVIVFIPISYPFACYINRSKKWFKVAALYIFAFIIILSVMTPTINIFYNEIIGRYCNTGSDCGYSCVEGVVGKYFLPVSSHKITCTGIPWSDVICENHRCISFDFRNVTSIEYCNRTEGAPEAYCYYTMAIKQDDNSLCNRAQRGDLCYNLLSKKLNTSDLCNKVENWKSRCICYYNSAKGLDNRSLCDKIEYGVLKEMCIEHFEK